MPRLALILLVITIGFFAAFPPSRAYKGSIALGAPFQAEQGAAFVAKVPEWLPADHPDAPSGSRATVFEDGSALGPAHSGHAAVRNKGHGRFSHWGRQLYFSTSDGTDPNTNGRSYELRFPTTMPVFAHVAALLVFFIVVISVAMRGWSKLTAERKRLRMAGFVTIHVLATFGLLEATVWILTCNRLHAASDEIRLWYRHLFEGGEVPRESASALYAPHPFLNYTLNPSVAADGRRLIDPDYLIRREEPLRPRSALRWRALVLGGSTTFGEFLTREQDTWVHQLEQKVRAEVASDDVDVVNGGVSGYTLVDNLVHYSLLLSRLQPDVVLFYTGINDVQPRWHGSLRPDYANFRKPWSGEGSTFPPVAHILSSSWSYRYWYLRRHMWNAKVLHILNFVANREPPPDTWAAGLDRNGPQLYQGHLQNFVRLLQSQGCKVVILPQYFRPVRPADQALARGIAEHNAVNAEVARQLGVFHAPAVLAPGIFDEDDCFDNCHFNARGSAKMAQIVFQFLREHRLLPTR